MLPAVGSAALQIGAGCLEMAEVLAWIVPEGCVGPRVQLQKDLSLFQA
jgi:hypothetical protein